MKNEQREHIEIDNTRYNNNLKWEQDQYKISCYAKIKWILCIVNYSQGKKRQDDTKKR